MPVEPADSSNREFRDFTPRPPRSGSVSTAGRGELAGASPSPPSLPAPESPPRVLHLIKGLGRGGAESLLVELLRLPDRRCDHSVGYFLAWKDDLAAEIEASGAVVRCFPCDTTLGMATRIPALTSWLRREEIELLHCHLPTTGVLGRLVGRWVGLPVVYTEHNLLERYRRLTRWANLGTWGLQDAVVAVSEGVAASIRRHRRRDDVAAGRNGLGGVPLRVIHNGIDPARVACPQEEGRRLRVRLGIPHHAPVVGTVAVLRAQKRLDLWIEAAGQVLGRRPDAHFLIVGDGPLRPVVARQARSVLGARAHLVGLQPDVGPYLAAMDVYLLSSQFEGLPLTLLEAMAARRPVVATAVGGIPEVLTDESMGIVVPPLEPRALAASVLDLLADEPRRRSMVEAAHRRVVAGFSLAQMLRRLEDLYLHVLRARDAAHAS